MKSSASAVPVTIEIDRDRLDRVEALAKIKGLDTKTQLGIFLARGLNQPTVRRKRA